jgi:hypothetical protein
MAKWAFALGGLIVWAAHFFLLYAFASIFPGTDLARMLSLIATIPALGADALLLTMAAKRRLARSRNGDVNEWMVDLGGLGAAGSLVAVVWMALPAVLLPAGT